MDLYRFQIRFGLELTYISTYTAHHVYCAQCEIVVWILR